MSRIEDRFDPLPAQDAVLIRARRAQNKVSARRIVENEVTELLLRLADAVADAEEGQELLAMAKWSGSDHEDALRLSLQKLTASASSRRG